MASKTTGRDREPLRRLHQETQALLTKMAALVVEGVPDEDAVRPQEVNSLARTAERIAEGLKAFTVRLTGDLAPASQADLAGARGNAADLLATVQGLRLEDATLDAIDRQIDERRRSPARSIDL